jgi:hypothetical protein
MDFLPDPQTRVREVHEVVPLTPTDRPPHLTEIDFTGIPDDAVPRIDSGDPERTFNPFLGVVMEIRGGWGGLLNPRMVTVTTEGKPASAHSVLNP